MHVGEPCPALSAELTTGSMELPRLGPVTRCPSHTAPCRLLPQDTGVLCPSGWGALVHGSPTPSPSSLARRPSLSTPSRQHLSYPSCTPYSDGSEFPSSKDLSPMSIAVGLSAKFSYTHQGRANSTKNPLVPVSQSNSWQHSAILASSFPPFFFWNV